MPSLKDLNCAIELSESQQALREFGTIYGDGFVETFVPVPSKPQPFSIHLTSNKFIAPGVAIFVYVDGVYQCNRNRQNLKLRKPSDSRSLVDFRVRQKEERQKDGSMIAREWAFDKFNIASADDAPNLCSPTLLNNIGCIEVVVLRCAGTRNAKSASTMNFDGAGDFPDRRFDLDDNSSPSNERSMYDDRGPFFKHFGNGHGPPPPISSYHSPYAETLRSQEGSASRSHYTKYTPQELFPPVSVTRNSQPRSRYSEPISPGTRRTSGLPTSGFQYGSGPVPRDGEIHNRLPNVGVVQPPAVDPIWLNNLLTTAVKQGVEESRRMDVQSKGQTGYRDTTSDAKTKSQPPGAWPDSPFDAPTLPHHQSEQPAFSSRDHQTDHGSNWAQSQTGWGERPSRSRAGTHVTWNVDPIEETGSSSIGGWNSREETPSDSWDTGDTWPTDRVAEWKASSQQGKSWAPNPPTHYNAVPSSPITLRRQSRRRSKHNSQPKSRSKSRSRHPRRKHEVISSSSEEEDKGSWSYLDRPSESVVSLSSSDDIFQPMRSHSQIQTSRRSSKSRSRPSKSIQREHERKASRHSSHAPAWGPADGSSAPVPSVITRVTPTVMNAPVPAIPMQVPSCQPSVCSNLPAPVLPSSGWGADVHDTMRKSSIVPSHILPAPYAPSLKDFVQSTVGERLGENRSSSSSSWGTSKKDSAGKLSWGEAIGKDAGWSITSDSGWQDKTPKENDKDGYYTTIADDKIDSWTKNDDDKKAEADDSWNTKDTEWGPPKQEKDITTNDWAGLKSALESAFKNRPPPPPSEIPLQNQSWTFPSTKNPANPALHQTTTTPFTSAPAPAPSPPKQAPRMSNKSLSKYRPNHLPTPNPHWQFPPLPSPPATIHPTSNTTYLAPALPRQTITQQTSLKTGIQHAVRPGKATHYGHVIGRPEYLDSLRRPYAVFRFKYRSERVLEGMFGEGVVGSAEGQQGLGKGKRERVPRDEVVDGVAAKHGKERHGQRRASGKTDGGVKSLTEEWVQQHSGG